MGNPDDIAGLQAENARLVALLEAHGIQWKVRPTIRVPAEPSKLSTDAKVTLFRRLFRGRTDVFPVRWESKTTGRSGFAPACANEWRPGVCEKPRIKCADCSHRQLIALSDAAIYAHLAGEHTLGVYPLLDDDSCYFLAADFDEADWREDARAFAESCAAFEVPVALEISRSGRGAHAWIFFEGRVPARDARRLGTALISHTCVRRRQLQLASYDRLFPNQDMMPKGGFGNLIALPLQKSPREMGYSVFVDLTFTPYADQWGYLASIRPMNLQNVEPVILQATGGAHPLDVTFIDEEDLATPWNRQPDDMRRLTGSMPRVLEVTRANMLYFEKDRLPQPLANRLIRLAAFQNPEFYRAQAMRLSVWDKPRVIGCAENYPKHIALPRGCLEAVQTLLRTNDIECDLKDERYRGKAMTTDFVGHLRSEQESAVAAMLPYDEGVLCAPTAFGKTVTAAAMIARRRVNTLILVHRTELLKQWHARLRAFLNLEDGQLGIIGGGKSRPSGSIDIAVMQSLSRQGEVHSLVDDYGQVIIDECHHVGAASFEAILKRAKAKYVLGLTATPIRRDGQQPVIFLQCGPIRHTASRPAGDLQEMAVLPRWQDKAIALPPDCGIQDVFRSLAMDSTRTESIAAEANFAYRSGHKVLVLTERTEHLEAIGAALAQYDVPAWILHGRMSKKQRASLLVEMEALAPDSARILVATGKLVGEGFDHPALDTLILAMPVSWKGTLQQYAGRLHREHTGKVSVRIIDWVDTGHPALMRMWQKRQRGYRAMGYRVDFSEQPNLVVPVGSTNL